MAVRLVFLGKLADLAGMAEQDAPAPLDWVSLLAQLPGPLAQAAMQDRTKLALNGVLQADKTALAAADGDEVALLPPVSGG